MSFLKEFDSCSTQIAQDYGHKCVFVFFKDCSHCKWFLSWTEINHLAVHEVTQNILTLPRFPCLKQPSLVSHLRWGESQSRAQLRSTWPMWITLGWFRACGLSYLDAADSALLEGALGHVVGADVPIFTPVAGERAAYAWRAPARKNERLGGEDKKKNTVH